MTKVIDRLAHGEGRGFMTALGRQPGAGRLRELLLYVYGYVVMPEHVHLLLSEPNCPTQAKIGLESATPPSNCPTQAKVGLEWATCALSRRCPFDRNQRS